MKWSSFPFGTWLSNFNTLNGVLCNQKTFLHWKIWYSGENIRGPMRQYLANSRTAARCSEYSRVKCFSYWLYGYIIRNLTRTHPLKLQMEKKLRPRLCLHFQSSFWKTKQSKFLPWTPVMTNLRQTIFNGFLQYGLQQLNSSWEKQPIRWGCIKIHRGHFDSSISVHSMDFFSLRLNHPFSLPCLFVQKKRAAI